MSILSKRLLLASCFLWVNISIPSFLFAAEPLASKNHSSINKIQVDSLLQNGLDTDVAIATHLKKVPPLNITPSKKPLTFNVNQTGSVKKLSPIPAAFPSKTQTWYNTPRDYWVYTPYGYKQGDRPNLLLVLDGHRMDKELNLNGILDHLIETKQIPPTLMVRLHTGRGQGRDGDDRRWELMRTNAEWANYVAQQLFPKLRAKYTFNEASENWLILGSSSSAVGAFSMAWFKPNCFKRVIALSPSFVSLQVKRANDWVNAEQFYKLVAQSNRQDLRVYLTTGLKDLKDADGPTDEVLTWANVNTQLAETLDKKGHTWRYFFRKNHGHNSDYSKPQMDEILKWAWQGVEINLKHNAQPVCQ